MENPANDRPPMPTLEQAAAASTRIEMEKIHLGIILRALGDQLEHLRDLPDNRLAFTPNRARDAANHAIDLLAIAERFCHEIGEAEQVCGHYLSHQNYFEQQREAPLAAQR